MTLSTDSPPSEVPSQRRQASADLRDALIAAAMVEFSQHGFEGASTRAIAQRAGAHQPQINYHFDSKDALWRAVVERLLGELDALIAEATPADAASDPVGIMAAVIRSLVRFAALRPELNRIMIHEGTSPSERLEWLVESQVTQRADALTALWDDLIERGEAAPVPTHLVYHLLIGASALLHANAPEYRLLFDGEPSSDEVVEAHADALVAMFLPTTARPEIDRPRKKASPR